MRYRIGLTIMILAIISQNSLASDSSNNETVNERPKSLLIVPWKPAPEESPVQPPWAKNSLLKSEKIRDQATLQRRLDYHRHFLARTQ